MPYIKKNYGGDEYKAGGLVCPICLHMMYNLEKYEDNIYPEFVCHLCNVRLYRPCQRTKEFIKRCEELGIKLRQNNE